MKLAITKVRRSQNRCEERKKEEGEYGKRSWRCQLEGGHKGDHISLTGHRRWAPSDE